MNECCCSIVVGASIIELQKTKQSSSKRHGKPKLQSAINNNNCKI